MIVCSLPCRTIGAPVMVIVGPRLGPNEILCARLVEPTPTNANAGKNPKDETKG